MVSTYTINGSIEQVRKCLHNITLMALTYCHCPLIKYSCRTARNILTLNIQRVLDVLFYVLHKTLSVLHILATNHAR